MERIGTGDTWSTKVDWKDSFIDEIQKKARVILTSEPSPYQGNILNASDKTLIGTYKLLHSLEMRNVFGGKNWWRKKPNMNIRNCRYLGEEKGWCAFTLFSSPYNENLMTCLVKVCRGIFQSIESQCDPVPCLIYYPLWCHFDRGAKNQRSAVTHLTVNRNLTPVTFEFLAKYGSPTGYSRHLQNALLKLDPHTRLKNFCLSVGINPRERTESTIVWCWVYSTLLVKSHENAAKLDEYWQKLRTDGGDYSYFWLKLMKKE